MCQGLFKALYIFNSFNSHKPPLLISPFQMNKQAQRRLYNLPKATQLLSQESGAPESGLTPLCKDEWTHNLLVSLLFLSFTWHILKA